METPSQSATAVQPATEKLSKATPVKAFTEINSTEKALGEKASSLKSSKVPEKGGLLI